MIKVLIVEDDPMVAELNRRYLATVEGFELAAVAKTGDQALIVLEKNKIDLVLLDVFMPGLNGIELLVRIRNSGLNTDVILLTAARDSGSINKALQYGAVDYLIKPFEFERFSEALLKYKNRRKFINAQDNLDQAQIDRRVLFREHTTEQEADLPKGLDRNTLKRIWDCISGSGGQQFSTEELARQAGISRVSMRKYLDFLERSGFLSLELAYGSVGRPVYKYKCTGKKYLYVSLS